MARQPSSPLDRRAFLSAGAAATAGAAFAWRPIAALAAPKVVTIVEFSDAGVKGKTVQVPKVEKTDAEWRSQLQGVSFSVTRHEDTERPFTGVTWNNHDAGLYRCICCDTALFSSDTKFESGTGWPSFWAPIAKENIVEKHDATLGMERTAVECRRCDAHLGHVFDDGPKPTGLRYCMNSASMRFVKRA